MYIAYSRMYIFPVTTQEVSDYITEFYVNVRSLKLDNPNNPVPITARNVEAVQRIAEAHARMRLSEWVTKEDVDAAKRIIRVSLENVGMDENGRLDAGLQNGGESKSQQDKIRWLLDTVVTEKEESEIYTVMKESYGVNKDEVSSLLKNLSSRGKVFRVNNTYKVTR